MTMIPITTRSSTRVNARFAAAQFPPHQELPPLSSPGTSGGGLGRGLFRKSMKLRSPPQPSPGVPEEGEEGFADCDAHIEDEG